MSSDPLTFVAAIGQTQATPQTAAPSVSIKTASYPLYSILTDELQISSTLLAEEPSNPLNTELARKNNLTDPQSQIRNNIITALNLRPSTHHLSLGSSKSVLCSLVSNDHTFKNKFNSWADELKQGFDDTDSSLDNKSDIKKMKIYSFYVSETLKRYFQCTQAYSSINEFGMIASDDFSKESSYKKVRCHYFDLIYNQLYAKYYDTVFKTSTSDGIIDLSKSFAELMQNFQTLTTDVTYGQYIDNLMDLCNQLNTFLNGGVLDGFLHNFVNNMPFNGENIAGIEDKLNAMNKYLFSIPGDLTLQSDLIKLITSDTNHTNPASDAFSTRNFRACLNQCNTASVVNSVIRTVIYLILHLLEKFVPHQNNEPYSGGSPANYISTNGFYALITLLGYIINVEFSQDPVEQFESLYSRFSTNDTLTSSDLNIILGAPLIDNSGKNPIVKEGILQYVLTNLKTLLSSKENLVLYNPTNSSADPIESWTRGDANASYFGGSFVVDWTTQNMEESEIDPQGYFTLVTLNKQHPEFIIADSYKSLKTVLTELINPNILKACLSVQTDTLLNIIERINFSSDNSYFNFTKTNDSYSLMVEDSDLPENTPSPENKKYIYRALNNYMFFSICKDSLGLSLDFDLKDLEFSPSNGEYIINSSDISKLLNCVATWDNLMYASFYGKGKYFSPDNLTLTEVYPGWKTYPVIFDLFYLMYRYDSQVLNDIYYIANHISTARKNPTNVMMNRGRP